MMGTNSASWQRLPIVSLCEAHVDCVNRTAPIVNEPTPFKMLRTTNVRNGYVDAENVRYVTEETYKKWTRRLVPKRGDIILTREAPLGDVGKIRTDDKVFLGQRLYHFRPDPKKLDADFMLYSLLGVDLQSQIKGFGSGSTVEHMRLEDIPSLEFNVPPLPVQKRIAGILSAYDELIENSQRRIKILEAMARTLYREWFVHFRFPGHENHPRVASPLGEIPQGWEATTLGRLVEIRKGKNITKDTIRDGQVPVVAGGIAPAYFHDAPNTQSPVITISASGANAGFVNLYYVDVWASDCSYIDSSATPFVYYYYLWLDYRRSAITHLQRGSAQPHVYPKDLAMLEALRAPEDVLNAFTSQVAPIFDLTMRLAAKIDNLRRTRDLLLPRLLSGQIDVEAITP